MDLLKEFPEFDMKMLHHYFCCYGDYNTSPRFSDMNYIMREWSRNKLHLYKMFHNQFILEKEVLFEKPMAELVSEMDHALWGNRWNNPVYDFCSSFEDYILKYHSERFRTDNPYFKLYRFITDYEMLVENVYDGDTFTIEKDGKELVIPHGCKAVKMLGKIAKFLGLDYSNYEAFRIAHSMVLNQRKIKGILCLSIHPLDYVTMSDNNCDWSSCMSWMEEAGDYRLGTIEMMNSPCVVVAYIKSCNDVLEFDAQQYNWNSKRWRQLLIVTPELILGNKQYPYENSQCQGMAMKWLRELASNYPGYGPYGDTAINICNCENNLVDGERKIYFNIRANFMYNDVYDFRMAYFHTEYNKPDYEMNFSGPAICTTCGEVIELHSVEPNRVSCRNCLGEFLCEICGEWCSISEEMEVDGHSVCEWCYSNELTECPICEERHFSEEMHRVYIKNYSQGYDKRGPFNNRYSFKVCSDCFNSDEFTELFGPYKIDSFTLAKTVDIKNITDEALEYCSFVFSTTTKEYIKAMRDATTLEEMKKIDDKYNHYDYDPW